METVRQKLSDDQLAILESLPTSQEENKVLNRIVRKQKLKTSTVSSFKEMTGKWIKKTLKLGDEKKKRSLHHALLKVKAHHQFDLPGLTSLAASVIVDDLSLSDSEDSSDEEITPPTTPTPPPEPECLELADVDDLLMSDVEDAAPTHKRKLPEILFMGKFISLSCYCTTTPPLQATKSHPHPLRGH